MAGTIVEAARWSNYLGLNRRRAAGSPSCGQARRTTASVALRRMPQTMMEPTMFSLSQPTTFLRRVLLADAAVSGATGLMLMLGARLAEGLLGVPAALMQYSGASL